MKENLRMAISFIAIITMPLLFLTSGTVSTDISNKVKKEKAGLSAIFSKDYYYFDEAIYINYILDNNDEIIKIEFDCDGFSVQKDSKDVGMITAFLDRKDENSICSLKADAILKEGGIVSSYIYGFCGDCGVFISKYSVGHAKQLYYEYLVNKKAITEDEMYKLTNDDIKKSIIYEENNEICSNRSVVELDTQLVWIEDGETNADEHPLAFTKFQLIDNNSSITSTYYTDENGYFPTGIYVNTPTNLTIKIYAAGENTNVVKWTLLVNTPWVYEGNYSETTSKITVTSISSTDYGRAQQVSQALIYAEKYAQIINGEPLSPVSALYPASTTDYDSFLNMIRISGETTDFDYSDWDVIMHEYGHHVTSELQLEENPGLEHYSDENLADRYDKSRGTRLAWDEALATIFGAMAQEYFSSELITINMVADGGYSDNGYLFYYYDTIPTRIGEACESTIMGILWDLFDSDATPEDHDTSSMTHLQFWSIMISSEAKRLSDYVEYYYTIYDEVADRQKIGKILEYYKVSPENVHLSTNSSYLGYTAPTFQWIANGTSSTLQNNSFIVRIIRDDFLDYIDISTTNTSLTLTEEQWNTVINWPCSEVLVTVYGYQTGFPTTGPYGQGYQVFVKPQFKISSFNETASIIGLYYCTTALNFPSQIDGKQVISIGNEACKNYSSITSVTIPNTITNIGQSAFENCSNLTVINQSSNLAYISASAFKGCTALTSITIPNSVTNINSYAFENCTSLSSITLNSGLTFLGGSVFKGCSSLYSISIPSGVSIINPNAFENCTNLHSITLSNNLTTISNAAFKGCTSLTSISIPSTVTSIGDDAFKNCSALTSVVVGRNAAPITTLGSNAFSGCPSSLQITAPQNRVGDYKNDINWFAHRNKIPFNPNSYYAYYVNNASNINITNNISAGYNIVYKLIVSDTNTYKIESSSTYNVMLKIYDSNMMLLNSNVNILSCYLTSGSTYYLSIEFNNASFSGTISTNIIQDSNHYHNYSYSWNSYINHRKYCACGNSSLKAHVVSPDAFNNGQQYAECTLCHGLASIGANPMSQNNYPYTLNGSFILPNGVIVLVEEDYEAYMNDTLVFINPNDNIDRGNTFIPCLIRREENYWSSLS